MPNRKTWITDVYQAILAEGAWAHPALADLPALGQLTITRPELLKPFAEYNRRHPDQAVRPGGFISVCYPKPFARAQPIRLFAPYTTPKRALHETWYDMRTGEELRITTEDPLGQIVDGLIPVKSYRDIALSYISRPEAKFAHGSEPCLPGTSGTLQRRHIRVKGIEHLGKEANLLDRRLEGGDAAGELQQVYATTNLTDVEIEALALRPRRLVAASVGISERALRDILNRKSNPRAKTALALRQCALET